MRTKKKLRQIEKTNNLTVTLMQSSLRSQNLTISLPDGLTAKTFLMFSFIFNIHCVKLNVKKEKQKMF